MATKRKLKLYMNSTLRSATGRCAVIALLLLISLRAFADTQFTNEFWVCNTTNTGNLGTLRDPYDGSTRQKFDTIMVGLPKGCTVHILGGTYLTHGNQAFQLRDQ